MTLKMYALELKKALEDNPSPENIDFIVNKIINGRYSNGIPFSDDDIETIIAGLNASGYDSENDSYIYCESSNEAHIKLLNYVRAKIEAKRGK